MLNRILFKYSPFSVVGRKGYLGTKRVNGCCPRQLRNHWLQFAWRGSQRTSAPLNSKSNDWLTRNLTVAN